MVSIINPTPAIRNFSAAFNILYACWKKQMLASEKTLSGIKSIFISATIAFFGVVIITALAYFVSSIYAAAFSSLSVTFLVMLISATISKDTDQCNAVDNTVELSAVLYFVLWLGILLWFMLNKYAWQNLSWTRRNWYSFLLGAIVPWLISVIVLVVLDLTWPHFHDRYTSNGSNIISREEEPIPVS